MPKLPFMQFFPNDWLAEPTIRVCSIAARGLWMDMLSLMHLSPRRGYLLAATGSPITPEQLARLTGCSAEEVTRLLAELRASGVFNCTDDGLTIYSRRMVRDEGKREKCRDAGRKGGNPNLTVRKSKTGPTTCPLKGDPKGGLKGGSKGQSNPLEARSQTLEARDQTPPTPRGAETEAVGPSPAVPFDPLRAEQESRKLFERRWADAGLRKFSYLSPSLKARLQACLLDAWWAEHYPAALARAAAIPFLATGAGRANGAIDVGWFLRDVDEARKILDGVYDPKPAAGTKPADRKTAELDAVIEDAMRKAG